MRRRVILTVVILSAIALLVWSLVPRPVEAPLVREEFAVAAPVPVGDIPGTGEVEVVDSERQEDPVGEPTPEVPVGAGSEPAPATTGWGMTKGDEREVFIDPAVYAAPSAPGPLAAKAVIGPNRLLIPSLGVYAKMRTAAVTNGYLDLPRNPQQVGLWGSVFAEQGSTVVSGHVNYNGVQGALWGLSKAKPGAVAYLTDNKGGYTRWVLTSLKNYPKAALPQKVWDNEGDRVLYVVTCGGKVINHHYTDNVVATFVPAS